MGVEGEGSGEAGQEEGKSNLTGAEISNGIYPAREPHRPGLARPFHDIVIKQAPVFHYA